MTFMSPLLPLPMPFAPLAWLTGFRRVPDNSVVTVHRFGRFVRALGPGWRWTLPGLDQLGQPVCLIGHHLEVREGEGRGLKWARLEPYHGYKLAFEIEFDHPAVNATGQRVEFDRDRIHRAGQDRRVRADRGVEKGLDSVPSTAGEQVDEARTGDRGQRPERGVRVHDVASSIDDHGGERQVIDIDQESCRGVVGHGRTVVRTWTQRPGPGGTSMPLDLRWIR